MTKGYTRKITRKQALSYSRLVPNGMGVTAIAAVNGRGVGHRGKKHRSTRSASHPANAFTQAQLRAGFGGKRKQRAASHKNATRYTTRGARQELKVLKSERRFSPTELKTLQTRGRVTRGSTTYRDPYFEGYERSHPAPNRRKAKKKSAGAAYQRRYRQTRDLLEANVKKRRRRSGGHGRRIAGMPIMTVMPAHFEPIVVRAPRRRARRASTKERPMKRKKRRTAAQRAATKRMIAGLQKWKRKSGVKTKRKVRGRSKSRSAGTKKKTRRRSSKRRYADNKRMTKAQRSRAAKKAARTRARKHLVRSKAAKKAARTRKHGRRRSFFGRNLGQKRRGATTRLVANKKKRGRKKSRSYGRLKPIVASVGRKKIRTYMYRTKSGGVKHLPIWAIAGAKSQSAFRKYTEHVGAGGKTGERVRRRVAAIMRARGRAAGRVSRHGDVFTPNRAIVPLSTWSSSMRSNRKKKRKVAKSSKRSRAARKAARTRAEKHAIRSRAAKKAARTRKRRHGGGRKHKRSSKRRYAANRRRLPVANRRRRHHRKHRRNGHAAAAATPNRRRRRHHRRNRRRSYATLPSRGPFYANRRRRHKKKHYADNRRRRHGRRRYEANAFRAKDFMSQLFAAFKVGIAVSVGFIGHRALSKMLSKTIAPTSLGTSLGQWTDTVSQLLVAAGGMVGLSYLGENTKSQQARSAIGQANAGVFGSFAHALITMLVKQAAPQYVDYLSGYPDSAGRAYSGMGEYFATQGFGAMPGRRGAPMLTQAAAGFGAHPMLTQAAAGTGEYFATQGFGGPMLTQAAAGTGEYFASGVQGIGDYEVVAGVGGGSFGADDDGIAPNLNAAENALNIAEAAAGMGLGDLGTKSQQYPMMVAKPIKDAPGGSRAGTFSGRDGIFG